MNMVFLGRGLGNSAGGASSHVDDTVRCFTRAVDPGPREFVHPGRVHPHPPDPRDRGGSHPRDPGAATLRGSSTEMAGTSWSGPSGTPAAFISI